MPFSETKHKKRGQEITIEEKEWKYIFNNWIKKAVESYSEDILCKRSDLIPGNFVKGIVKDLNNSEIVIADLTGKKPNVYYELGIRHSLRIGTIIITQDLQSIPSDLSSYYCFEYDYDQHSFKAECKYKLFESELHKKIQDILENRERSDNPISDFLDLDHFFRISRLKKEKELLVIVVKDLESVIEIYMSRIKGILKEKDDFLLKKHMPFVFIDIMLIDSIYMRFYSFSFEEIDSKEISFIGEGLNRAREIFIYLYQFWDSATKNINNQNINTFLEKLTTIADHEDDLLSNFELLKSSVDNLDKTII